MGLRLASAAYIDREAFAGQAFADGDEMDHVATLATKKLNRWGKPWTWGRPPRLHRHLRYHFVYCL